MIVVDASAALSALLNAGPSRTALAGEQLHAPHLIDSEVAHGLRRHVASGRVSATDGWAALDTWRRLGLTRHPVHGVLERVWELRDNLSAYDAGYVALAESLGGALVTADARISRAPGIRCPVTVVPR
ncbi:MAG: type II toxin-antitoxin system VapC family toxin [Dermatophilaceae bacterium]